jgi:hypothetical protein
VQPGVEIMQEENCHESATIKAVHMFLIAIGCMGLIIGFQGLVYISMAIYSTLFYKLVSWHPNHTIIGGIVTYSLFIVEVVLLLMLLTNLVISERKQFNTAFRFASSFYLILYPIMPVLWYDNRYSIDGPTSGYLYGFEMPIFPVFVGIGVVLLLSIIQEERLIKLFSKVSPDTVSLVIFSCLALLIITASFFGLYFSSNLGYLNVRATIFTLIPNIVGLSLLISTVIFYKYTMRKGSVQKP